MIRRYRSGIRTGAGLQLEPYDAREYRAYDLVTEWSGPVRSSPEDAGADLVAELDALDVDNSSHDEICDDCRSRAASL